MRRRQPAAPEEVVDTEVTDTTDITRESSPDTATEPTTASEPGEAPPAKPRRTRRTQATLDAAPGEPAPVAEAPKPRTRRPRKPATPETEIVATPDTPEELAPIVPDVEPTPEITDPVTPEDIPAEASDAPDAEQEIVAVFGDDAEGEPVATNADLFVPQTDALLDDEPFADATAEDAPLQQVLTDTASVSDTASVPDAASLSDLLAKSEAILEEVLGETASGDASRRSRNRRGRGRGGRSGEPATETPAAPAPDEPLRKRGPRVLARTLPLPALPATGEPPAETVTLLPNLRKRGVRATVVARRVLTASGVSVVSPEQAAALLGSVVLVPSVAGDAASPLVPLVAVVEPVAPGYVPLPLETLERFAPVTVTKANGVPELRIADAPVLPAFLFVNTEVVDEPDVAREIAVRQIRFAYEAGVRLFTLPTHLPWRRKSGERRFDSLDAAFGLFAEHAPDAHVLPRLIFSPPVSWERANPDDMAQYVGGEPGDVSLGSDAFWEGEATDALRAAIEHLASGDHAGRTLGVYLEHGEWLQPRGVGVDRSPANTARFRAFLKSRYKNSEVALRAAWYDGSVTFDTAEIPTPEQFAGIAASGAQPLFLGEREERVSDFHRYTSRITAERITHLAAVAKNASANRLAVAVSYGYTLELARPNCGHYALSDLLASPDVDILTAPFSYTGRLPGGSAPFAVPVDSIHLSGKLLICEDDTKTHLALRPTDDAYNPKIEAETDTRAVHARNVGTAVAKGCGISWMDTFGEGWLGDAATWEHLGGLMRVMDAAAQMRRAANGAVAAPEVAVFVDEQSFFETGDAGEDSPLLAGLVGTHRDRFARAGASVGYYLLSDLLHPDFPETPVLFVFLAAFRLPVAIRTAIQTRWQTNGRTLAWLFAPGVREAGNIAELGETVGMQLRLQPWGSRTGTVVTDGRFVLTENAKGERFGEDKRTNPSLTVLDPKAQLLGEYVASGNPSLAYRKHPRWQSVFVGEREMPLPLIRGLYRLAGVPIATPGDDAVSVAGDGFVSVHGVRDSDLTLFNRGSVASTVYDALSGELLAGVGFGARTQAEARTTRLLFFAAPEVIGERFAVSEETLNAAPEPLTESDLPEPAKPFVFEAVPSVNTVVVPPPGPRQAQPQAKPPQAPAQPTRLYPVELSVSAEDIAQFEAALAGEIALLDKEGDAESGTASKKRRRRRRGNRSGEGIPETDALNGEGDAEDEGDTDTETADAVFALADLTDSATAFDALLPLVPAGDVEEEPAQTLIANGTGATDPVADMMARLFAMPELVSESPVVLDAPRDSAPVELAPMDGDADESAPDDLLFPEEAVSLSDPLVDAMTPDATETTPQPDDTDGAEIALEADDPDETEEPLGLLVGATNPRPRRTRTAGGFASRLRRRAAERSTQSTAETGAEENTVSDENGETQTG